VTEKVKVTISFQNEKGDSFAKSLVPDFSPLRGPNSRALWTLLAIVAADQMAVSITAPFLSLFY